MNKQHALLVMYEKVWVLLDKIEDSIFPDRHDITFISQLFVDIFSYTTNQLYKTEGFKDYDLTEFLEKYEGVN